MEAVVLGRNIGLVEYTLHDLFLKEEEGMVLV